VARDAAQPRLDRALGAIAGHAAVRAQESLLRRLVGIGLRAEQRHAQTAEDRAVRLGARHQRIAVTSFLDERSDRIGGFQDGDCLHCILHVRSKRQSVTDDRHDFTRP
jgi:hypothetical protein